MRQQLVQYSAYLVLHTFLDGLMFSKLYVDPCAVEVRRVVVEAGARAALQCRCITLKFGLACCHAPGAAAASDVRILPHREVEVSLKVSSMIETSCAEQCRSSTLCWTHEITM